MESKVAPSRVPIREAWGCHNGSKVAGTGPRQDMSSVEGIGEKRNPDLVRGGSCHCCPYGYHIDLDFVRYCEALSNEKYVKQLKRLHKDRRKQRKSMEALLNYHEQHANSSPGVGDSASSTLAGSAHPPPPDVVTTSDALRNSLCDAMQDFEETFRKSTERASSDDRGDIRSLPSLELSLAPVDLLTNARNLSVSSNSESSSDGASPSFPSSSLAYHLPNGNQERMSPLFRSDSMSSLSTISSSTDVPQSSSESTVLPPSQQMADTMETLENSMVMKSGPFSSLGSERSVSPTGQVIGICPSMLQSIREQMAVSLQRMKELEEHAKAIPVLQVKLSVLKEEKRLLMLQLKAKSAKLDHRSVGVGDSSVVSSESEFDGSCGSIATSSTIRVDDLKPFIRGVDVPTRKSRSLGVNCVAMTRDIGVCHVPVSTRSVSTDCSKDLLSQPLHPPQGCSNCLRKSVQIKTISSGVNTDRHSLSVSVIEPQSIEPRPCEVCELRRMKKFENACFGTDSAITGWVFETSQQLPVTVTKVDATTVTSQFTMHSFGVQAVPSHRSAFIQTAKEVQPPKPIMKDCGIGTSVDVRHRGTFVIEQNLGWTQETGVGDTSITDTFCEMCIRKAHSKSIGVGLHNINDNLCSRCAQVQLCSVSVGTDDRLQTKTRSVGCGHFSVSDVVCDRCENRCVASVGVSTDVVPTERDSTVMLCDKCSSSITSMAHDFIHKTRPLGQDFTTVIGTEQKIEKSLTPQQTPRSTREFWRRRPELPSEFFVNKGFSDGQQQGGSPDKEGKVQTDELQKHTTTVDNSDSSDSSDSSDDSSSSDSPDEASYDSIRGVIIHSCKDDEAIRQGLPGAVMFQPISESPPKKYEFSSEIRDACKVLDDYLQKAVKPSSKEVNSSLNVIRQEWFRVSSQRNPDQHSVEDLLDALEAVSHAVLHKVVNLTDSSGNTALHYAISYANFDVVSLLLDSKVCDINKPNKAGYTCVMLASLASVKEDSHLSVLRQLFKFGDVNAKAAQHGQTALMLAASHGRLEIVKLLLEAGADINIQDDDGSTSLMCASEHGHIGIVKFLLALPDCDAGITDNDGSTALKIAMEAGHKDIGVLIYASMSHSRGSSPYASLRLKKRGSTPTRHLSTPPLPQSQIPSSPGRPRKSASSLSLN